MEKFNQEEERKHELGKSDDSIQNEFDSLQNEFDSLKNMFEASKKYITNKKKDFSNVKPRLSGASMDMLILDEMKATFTPLNDHFDMRTILKKTWKQ